MNSTRPGAMASRPAAADNLQVDTQRPTKGWRKKSVTSEDVESLRFGRAKSGTSDGSGSVAVVSFGESLVPEADLDPKPCESAMTKWRRQKAERKKTLDEVRHGSVGHRDQCEVEFWKNQIEQLSCNEHKTTVQVVPDGCPLEEEHLHWREKVDKISVPTPGGSSIVNHFPPRGANADEETEYWRKKMELLCVPTAKLISTSEAADPTTEARAVVGKNRHFWSIRQQLDVNDQEQLYAWAAKHEGKSQARAQSAERGKLRRPPLAGPRAQSAMPDRKSRHAVHHGSSTDPFTVDHGAPASP